MKRSREESGPTDDGVAKKTDIELESPLDPKLFERENIEKLKAGYNTASPFPHTVISPLCLDDRARKLEAEARTSLTANFKETDLFKLYQTGELANLNKSDAPELVSLRDALYSQQFREFVSEVSGIANLCVRPDAAANAYTQGCHLMCHDDVITTRRVTYVLYFTDPDEPWTEADGGAFEMYPVKQGEVGIPDVFPTKNVLPAFNQMMLFTVMPGVSFHAVQEVFTQGRPRFSVQGWFHCDEAPPGSELATRMQLQGPHADSTFDMAPWTDYEDATAAEQSEQADEQAAGEEELPPATLSEEDLAYLRDYINPEYLNLDLLTQVRDKFLDDENGSALQLAAFLRKDVADEIMRTITDADSRDGLVPADASASPESNYSPRPRVNYRAGVGREWVPVGPVHKQRFLTCVPGTAHPIQTIRERLLTSTPFKHWLEQVTCVSPFRHRSLVRRFRAGLDYTVAHYGSIVKKPVLDATLCFLDDRDHGSRELWQSGEVGGFECYLEADKEEEAEAAAVYGEDDDSNLLSVQGKFNTLSIVYRDTGVMKFTKYVSAEAPGSRWDVTAEYDLPEDEDSDEDEDQEPEKE